MKAKKENIKDIYQIRKRKLPLLQKARFTEQDKKESLYLIAFQPKKPVGYVYIKLKGSERHHTCPNIQDLYVKEELRKKGIAKQILQETEDFLKKLGYSKIGLNVETKEKWIKNFYENQGFKIQGNFKKISWIEKDEKKNITLKVFYLEKKLDNFEK